jgi:ssDNA-binding Zn-finger/Zn-ribbon topoisomerase 1
MLENPKCPHCGSPLDLVIEKNNPRVNACTNPECPGDVSEADTQNKNNSYT